MKPTLKEILGATLREINMTPENYKAAKKSRLERIVLAKRIISYVAVRYGYSLHSIADFLGVNHSAVSHHIKIAEGYCDFDKDFACKVDKVISSFEEVILCRKIKGWVAREKKKETLWFFSDKPQDVEGTWYYEGALAYILPPKSFPQVLYEDSPRSCELTLRLK